MSIVIEIGRNKEDLKEFLPASIYDTMIIYAIERKCLMFFSPFENFMFNAVPFIVMTFFVIIFIVFFIGIGKSISENIRNSKMEEITIPARIITKRIHVWGGHGNSSAHTSYYVTFEDENVERKEFSVSDSFYSMHAEGDTGMLTHKGTRFIHFERDRF